MVMRILLSLTDRWLLAVAAALCVLPTANAAELPRDLDSAADRSFLDSLFGRYGFAGRATILREPQGIRFQMPESDKALGQTGLYSLFALSGDFEFSARYEFIDIPTPTKGYGVSCGLALEAKAPSGMVQFSRVDTPKGSWFRVGRDPTGAGKDFKDSKDYRTRPNKKGQLVLRREKGELIYLAQDGSSEELEELNRIDFPNAVDKVRIFVDQGGSPTSLDVRLGPIVVKAERKATDPTQVEETGLPWWGTVLIIVGVLGVLGLAFVVLRRRREEN